MKRAMWLLTFSLLVMSTFIQFLEVDNFRASASDSSFQLMISDTDVVYVPDTPAINISARADDLATAMGVDPADLSNAAFSVDEIAGAVVYGSVGFLAPTDGDTFVMLSTGNAQPSDFHPYGGWIGTPDDFLSVDNENPNGTGPSGGEAYDLATLNLTLRAPDWAKSLSFDFRFMSEEYPGFVGTEFNDFFSCLLDATNIAFDTTGNIINVNNNFFDPAIIPEGTVFNGTTVLLTSKVPVTGGTTFELDFFVGDIGDSIYDTTVFLDNFRFSTEEVEEPVTVPTIWSSNSLGNEKNTFAPTETVYVTVPATGKTVKFYTVADKDVWNDGDPLTDVSDDGVEQLTLDPGPGIQVVQVWVSSLTSGNYDIVEDTNNDGFYSAGADGIDSVAEVGFVVEYSPMNNPPYQPQVSIIPSLTVEDNDNLMATVIGPTPADPDGDAVTYTYRWLVDVGTEGFLDDEIAGRENHTGNMVPAADTAVGDIWRVEVAPQDEHGAVGPSAVATWQPVVPPDATNPVANVGPEQTVVEDKVVSFDAGGSSDNVGIVSYEWDFGDETTGKGITVTHTYAEPGTYTVTLTVKDAKGNSNTDSIIITVQKDTDGDGTPNITDTDDDNDGVPDVQDAFPLDLLEFLDTDGDGIGDKADTDDDNDEVLDDDDAFSLDLSESTDTDADGIGNNADTDDDNDAMPDVWEIDNGLGPLDTRDASLDPDGDGLTNLQEYMEGKDPNAYDAEAIQPRSLNVVALVVGAGAAVTTAVLVSLGGLGQSFDLAVSKLPIPDKLKDFLELYGEKIFETIDKAKLETLERAPFITKGELVALGISAFITTIIFGFVEANGLPHFLDPSVLAAVIPATLFSVCIVSFVSELSEAFCARTCRVYRQFRLWMYGLVVFLVTGFVFLFPFASPGITRYQSGEISKKTKGLFVLSKMLLLLTLAIPFAGLSMLGFKIVGDAGLLLTLLIVCYSLVPLRPLVGKAVFDYRKEVSLTALFLSGILFYSCSVNLLPHETYLAVGVVSAFLAGITLNQLRKAHPK